MKDPIQQYWQIRLADVKKALEENNFDVYIADNSAAAKEIVLTEIIAKMDVNTVSWGGSVTLVSTGIYAAVRDSSNLEVLDVFSKKLPPDEISQMRRDAMLVDLFITGTNAVTEYGQLVNLDMYGNRVAAITFGPKNVVILVGRNKIVSDLNAAMSRIKDYAAPVNAMRLEKKTPCAKSSYCEECKSPERICNSWTITEKSFPKGRIKVVLINEDLGF
jgi:L-lactate utilization protein LutB